MAANDNIRFKQGSLAALNKQAKTPGTLWFTTDEGAIYLDINESASGRIRFGDYVIVDTVAGLPEAGHAYESALYYAKAENVLARWDAEANKWTQLNTPSFHSIAFEGSGNVLSGASVKIVDGKRVLTFTTQSVATSENLAELQTAVTANTNRFSGMDTGATVVSYVTGVKTELEGKITAASNLAQKGVDDAAAAAQLGQKGIDDAAKVAGDLATLDTKVTGIDGRLNTAETDITNLKNAVGEGGNVQTQINNAIAGVTGTEADEAGAVTVHGALKAAAAAQADATENAGNITQLNTDLGELETRVAANEGSITTLNDSVGLLNGEANVVGSVKNTVATEVAKVVANAPEDFDTLKEVADWIANDSTGAAKMQSDIADLKAAVNGENGQASQIAGLDTRLQAAEGSITSYGTRLDTAEQNITDLDAAYKAADEALEAKLKGTNLSADYDTLAKIEAKVKKNAEDITAANNAHGELATAVAGNTGNITTLTGRLDTAEADITDLKKIRAEFAAADTALENKLIGAGEGETVEYNTLKKAETAIKANASSIASVETTLSGSIGAIQNQLKWEVFE